jgi:hypothetical protein
MKLDFLSALRTRRRTKEEPSTPEDPLPAVDTPVDSPLSTPSPVDPLPVAELRPSQPKAHVVSEPACDQLPAVDPIPSSGTCVDPASVDPTPTPVESVPSHDSPVPPAPPDQVQDIQLPADQSADPPQTDSAVGEPDSGDATPPALPVPEQPPNPSRGRGVCYYCQQVPEEERIINWDPIYKDPIKLGSGKLDSSAMLELVTVDHVHFKVPVHKLRKAR